MTRDTADSNDSRQTIRGDKLLLAFRCLERYCAKGVAPQFLEAHFQACEYEPIKHPYGFTHWIGEMAIRAYSRSVISGTMNEVARHNADFIIEEVVLDAISSASPDALGELGLSEDDRTHFTKILTRFFNSVACEEITEKQLLRFFNSVAS